MHLELWDIGDKYVEIAKQMGTPSTVDQLLVSIDMPYSAKVIVVPLPPSSKPLRWKYKKDLRTQ